MYWHRHPLWDKHIWRPVVFSSGLCQVGCSGTVSAPGKLGAGRMGWALSQWSFSLHVPRVQRASATLKTEAEPYLPWSLEVEEAGWWAWRRPSSWNPSGGGSTLQSGRQNWWLRATPSTAPEAGGKTRRNMRIWEGGKQVQFLENDSKEKIICMVMETIVSEPKIEALSLKNGFFWFENQAIVNFYPNTKTKLTLITHLINEPLLLIKTKIIKHDVIVMWLLLGFSGLRRCTGQLGKLDEPRSWGETEEHPW